jgi:uncharacterized protein with GYD domain
MSATFIERAFRLVADDDAVTCSSLKIAWNRSVRMSTLSECASDKVRTTSTMSRSSTLNWSE